MGGYRQGSGRSKSGYYKGIYCGSTYELCWVIYSMDHNIEFTRFPGLLEKDGINYYPYFFLSYNNTIVETKGYEKQESVDRKTRVAESFGYTVQVLRKEDLKYAFDYVSQTYNTSKFYELYDGYKPKYTHVCNCCLMPFDTDRKIKTETKFCSRKCAGSFRKSINFKNGLSNEIREKISNTLKAKAQNGIKCKPYKRKNKHIWITDGTITTRIVEGSEIPTGFIKGRSKSL
jgi:hypothetical protein